MDTSPACKKGFLKNKRVRIQLLLLFFRCLMPIGKTDWLVRDDGDERIEPKFARRNEELESKRSVCRRVWWWCWTIIGKECPLP